MDSRALNRAIGAGKITRELRGVYRIVGSERTWESRLMAAYLWLGSASAISHHSAAALWKLPGFAPGQIELSTHLKRKTLPPVVVHHVALPIVAHTTTVGPIPLTNPGRTLVDVAGSLGRDELECALEDALRRRLTSVPHLHWLLKDRYGKGAKGCASLRALISDTPTVTESRFEMELLQAIRQAGLPLPVPQHEVFEEGRLVARLDFAYPWAKVAVEADSYRFHSGRGAWESDIDRRNALTQLGWLVINVTYRQMKNDMSLVAARIKGALMPHLGA